MEERCAKSKAAYAEKTRKMGFFLTLVDAVLLAKMHSRNIALVFYDKDCQGDPKMVPLLDCLNPLVPGLELQGFGQDERADTWIIACVRGDFIKGDFRELNHFVPVFRKSHMGEGVWSMVANEGLKKLKERAASHVKKLSDNSDEEDEDCLNLGIKELIQKLQSQIQFSEDMHRVGLHAATVPGDGDCLLWTFLSLEGGPVKRAQDSTKDHVQKMRADTCLLNNGWIILNHFRRGRGQTRRT